MAIRNQIQFRRGSSTEWVAISGGDGPALYYGEPGFDVTNNILKIGDGSTAWKDLKAIGADQSLYKVKNTSGGIIYKGQVVRANGTVGNSDAIQVTLFIADGSVPEYTIMGLATQDMDNNDFGYVTAFGQIRGIDTAPDGLSTNICAAGETWADGDILYASPSASGKLTKNIPQHETIVAIVLNAADNGSLFVRPTWYPHLSDLHDVDSSGVTNNQYLRYDSSSDMWVPTSSGIFNALSVSNDDGSSISLIDPDIDIYANEVLSLDGETSILLNSTTTTSKVGIATAFPDATLDVAGDINAEQIDIVSSVSGATLLNIEGTNGNLFSVVDSTSGSLMSVNDITGLPAFEVFSDHSIVAGRFNTNDFVISSGGDVGIGTATPSGKLHIVGDQYNNGYIYIHNTNAATPYTYNQIRTDAYDSFILQGGGNTITLGGQGGHIDMRAYSTNVTIGNSYNAGTTNQFIRFMPANSEAMRITNIGRVGIGTTSPAGNLSVVGADNGQVGIHVHNTTTTGYSAIRLGIDSAAGSQINIHAFNSSWGGTGAFAPNAGNLSNTTGALTLSATNAAGTIQFYTAGTGSANERVRITNTGNVGIGTTSAGTILSLQRSDATSYAGNHTTITNNGIDIYNNQSSITDAFTGISFRVAGSGYTNVGAGSINLVNTGDGDGDLTFVTRNNGTSSEKLRITYDGKVGVGTTSPSYKLEVTNNADSSNIISVTNTNNGTNSWSSLRAGSDSAVSWFISHALARTTNRYGFSQGGWTEILSQYGNGIVIGTDTSDRPIVFANNSTERMRIAAGGNVGISNIAPASLLTINTTIGTSSNINSTTGYAIGVHHSGVRITSPEDTSSNPNYPLINLLVSRPGGYQGGTASIDFDTRDRGNNFNRGIMARVAGGAMPNTGMNSLNGGYLEFSVAPTGTTVPTARMVIDRNGYVGIGTTSPASILDVRGSAVFNEAGADFDFRVEGDTDANLLFVDASTDRIGIGTSAPGCKLQVIGNIGISTTSGGYRSEIRTDGLNTSASKAFYFVNSAGSTLMTMAYGGNVGIGTTSPEAKLDIVNNGTALRLQNNDTGGCFWNITPTANNYSSGGSKLIFIPNTGSSTSATVTFNTDGNVGIGVTDPDEKLEVNGNIHLAANGTLYFGVAGTNTRLTDDSGSNRTVLRARGDTFDIINAAGTLFSATLRTGIIAGGPAAGHALVLKSTTGVGTTDYISLAVGNNGGTEGIRIINNGNVGIGTTTPSTKLHVAGIGNFGEPGSEVYIGYDNLGSDLGITTSTEYIAVQTSDSKFRYGGDGGSNIGIVIDSSYNVGIGTESPTYKLQVNGSFGATTKSFRIDHPSRPNYTLEYGSLESPYHGVRLTGRGRVVKGSGVVVLPPYLKDLIHDDETINIQITNIKHGKIIYVDEIDLNNDQFTVRVDRAKTLGTLEFFWTFTGTRKDVDKLVVEAEK